MIMECTYTVRANQAGQIRLAHHRVMTDDVRQELAEGTLPSADTQLIEVGGELVEWTESRDGEGGRQVVIHRGWHPAEAKRSSR